jgi:hypothetical protein
MNMADELSKPLFAFGNEAEWAGINEEETRQDAEFVTRLSIGERLELGQRLSDQAFELMNAFRSSGHGTLRDPRA